MKFKKGRFSLHEKVYNNNEFTINAKKNFKNWTSGNKIVDDFIKKAQLRAKNNFELIEWIEYDKFYNIEYLDEGGFGTIFKAIWKDGYIESWDFENNQWKRCNKNTKVALKRLNNSKDITNEADELLKEIDLSPEVLRGREYTQESDIYGFGIIANEICTGLPPYHDIAHDEFLATRICRGLRPKSNHKIPKLIFDIINQCWNGDPSKRPKAKELPKLLEDLIGRAEINNECLSLISTKSPATSIFSYTKHPHAIYTTRIIKYSKYSEYSASLKIDFANWT
ncbi:kinase-like domain-containing protein [Rhizophagus irregularis DAOM 181602=DAOM 197198]|nr:kinase-like domain-containing protein [Rhizophagus irregularis DAOM 181602=DAOM 197198]